MASSDQTEILRPFRTFLAPRGAPPVAGCTKARRGDPVKKRWAKTGVPEIHRPLGTAAWSEVTADGVDASPGDLVLDSAGRWCLVWNDALGALAERS